MEHVRRWWFDRQDRVTAHEEEKKNLKKSQIDYLDSGARGRLDTVLLPEREND